ncbi:MAG: ABC transporter permease, partial [Pseudomonadota bacterium]|nr:ABC transporter permease [Pseudomonadota bacterium]
LSPGDSIRLRTDLGQRNFTLAGVYYHYGSDQGLVAISRPIFDRYWRDTGVSSVGVYAAPGVDQERLKARIRALSGPSQMIAVKSNRALFVSSLRIFDRTFLITTVLRVLAGCVAFVGVFSALMAMQLERAHERCVLRACGVTPRQIGRLIILETAFMGLIAGIIALPVGIIIAVVLEMVVIPRSFGWVMTVHIVPSILLQGLMIGVLAAAFAALYPAWRTTRGTLADLRRHE